MSVHHVSCRSSHSHHVGRLVSEVSCLMSHVSCPRAHSPSKPGRSYDDRRSPQCTSPTVSPRPDYLACICRRTALADRYHSRRHNWSPSASTQLSRRRRHRPLPAAGATSSRPPSRLSHAPASQTPHDSRWPPDSFGPEAPAAALPPSDRVGSPTYCGRYFMLLCSPLDLPTAAGPRRPCHSRQTTPGSAAPQPP